MAQTDLTSPTARDGEGAAGGGVQRMALLLTATHAACEAAADPGCAEIARLMQQCRTEVAQSAKAAGARSPGRWRPGARPLRTRPAIHEKH